MRVLATRPGFGWRQVAAAVVFAGVIAAGGTAEAAGAKQKQAGKLFLRGEYRKALDLYAELAVSTGRPVFKCEIARCHHRLGNYRDARFNLTECLQLAQLPPAKRAAMEGLMAELNANLDAAPPAESAPGAEASPAAPTAEVPSAPATPEAASEPAGTGAVISAIPTPPPPTRTVVISGAAGGVATQSSAPSAPAPVPLAPAPDPAPAPLAAPPAPPYALPAPPTAASPAPAGGAHAAPGLYDTQVAREDRKGGWMRPTAYWMGALGLVAAGGGAVAGHLSNQKFQQVEEQYNDARYKNAQRLNLYQLVGYGVGAVSLGTALTFFLLAPDAEDAQAHGSTSGLRAIVGPTSFSVLGRF